MGFRDAVEKELREIQEVLDSAEVKYMESLELTDDFKAIACLDEAVDLVPDYGDAWIELARAIIFWFVWFWFFPR